MKKVLLVTLFLVAFLGFSQKVKLKDGVVLIDKVEVLKYDSEGATTTFSTLKGEEFVSIISTYYEAPNPARNHPGGHNFPATIRRSIETVRFLSSGKELTTDLGIKGIANSIHKSELISAEGVIDEEKVDKFINKYNNETLKLKVN